MTISAPMEVVNIVILGNFNPIIFQPAWFAAQELLRPQEVMQPDVQVIHPNAAVMRLEWLQLQILRERFQASTTQVQYSEPLRDLVKGVFTLLSYTPVIALGINREFQFQLESERQWHALGHRLAPKEDWTCLNNPGLLSLTIQGKRSDDLKGNVIVRVEPSQNFTYGVAVNVNHHFDINEDQDNNRHAMMLVDLLSTQWEHSMSESRAIYESVADLVTKE